MATMIEAKPFVSRMSLEPIEIKKGIESGCLKFPGFFCVAEK
jgi:hypothetical protein